MKIFVLTLAIAVMVQVSSASPLSRHKRSDFVVETIYEALDAAKETLPRVDALVKNSLKEIPKTVAYAKYVEMFEQYLTEVDEYKKTPGNCFKKTGTMLDKFMQFVEEATMDEETVEGKEVSKILENNGMAQLSKDFEAYNEKFESKHLDKELENLSKEDAIKIAPLVIEVC